MLVNMSIADWWVYSAEMFFDVDYKSVCSIQSYVNDLAKIRNMVSIVDVDIKVEKDTVGEPRLVSIIKHKNSGDLYCIYRSHADVFFDNALELVDYVRDYCKSMLSKLDVEISVFNFKTYNFSNAIIKQKK